MDKQVEQVFNDLDSYKRFCIQFGWPYNEADLYNTDKRSYQSFVDFKEGKRVPNNWVKDQKNMGKRKWTIKKKSH